MMSVFRSVAQHQFLILCHMLTTRRFGRVHVSVNVSLLYVFHVVYLKDHSGVFYNLGLFGLLSVNNFKQSTTLTFLIGERK